ncbi:AAA family ATPase [Candidatus Vallotia cooleyia]|uniref:AAA family ATPase n=1 Tax=Candidatus Vallotiella adelgis TaxID=1177211 RepID=UPI001D01A22C|nr:AAA family ATPase [Candidatus Vallotia cooleyia]UDG82618.1 AAA family ATPase [Candidatus Vallotia cooleyia]
MTDIFLSKGFSRRIKMLAESLGSADDDAQIASAAAEMVSLATANGHVYVKLMALAQHLGHSADRVRASLLASGVVMCINDNELAPSLPLVIDSNNRLYLARYYEFERGLANALAALAQTQFDHVESDDSKRWYNILSRYFGEAGCHNLDWQRVAAAVALSGQLTIVSGGPGTGKTTTVIGILSCLIETNQDLRIALAAPTGKAAQHMLEALSSRKSQLACNIAAKMPTESYTLHRLLGSAPDRGFRYHHRNPLPYDVIVVDEASMIDIALASWLVDAISPSARLILLGDKDQLAAVEAGSVFAELSAYPCYIGHRGKSIAQALGCTAHALRNAFSAHANGVEYRTTCDTHNISPDRKKISCVFDDGNSEISTVELVQNNKAYVANSVQTTTLANCVVWLKTNYRFSLDSPIGALSSAIRDGLSTDALSILDIKNDRAPTYFIEDSGRVLGHAAREYIASGFSCYTNLLAEVLRNRELPVDLLFDALNKFRVLCAVRAGPYGTNFFNDWISAKLRRVIRFPINATTQWFSGRSIIVTRNNYELGLFNGDIGIAIPALDGVLRVVFKRGDGQLQSVFPAMLPPHDTAFALTVHKSQGSEFERAVLVLPATFSRALSRELIYTAVTRARSQITIIGTRAVLEQAIRTPTDRDTGLSLRLRYAVERAQQSETAPPL